MEIQPKRHGIFSRGNTKTLKGEKKGYLTLILHLSPSTLNSQGVDLCPFSSAECRDYCLNSSGLSDVLPSVKKARIKKTDRFLSDRVNFLYCMMQEIVSYEKLATKLNLTLCIRLNGTSDIRWSKLKYQGQNIFAWFPKLQFYDYTKNPIIALESHEIKNYDVTFSWSGNNQESCEVIGARGINIAVPFAGIGKGKALPKKFMGKPVLDGDLTDLRFKDRKGYIVGLRVKGHRQRKVIQSTFLVQIERVAQ